MRNSSPQNWKWMGRSSHRSSGFTCQPSVVLVIAMRRLLQGKAPIERERASSRSHQPVLECSFRKGRPGERLLHRLRFDESEVIDPQPSTWPQHPVEFSQGLLEFKPMMHADGRHHRSRNAPAPLPAHAWHVRVPAGSYLPTGRCRRPETLEAFGQAP